MDSFAKHGVIPDVIDATPEQLLEIKYGDISVQPGQVMTPTQVKNPPTLKWTAEDGSFYTVIMTDPDAPSRKEPTFREWHHWMVMNVPGTSIDQGDHRSEYVGSGPPKDTGLHRYVFLVYKQPSGKTVFSLPKLTNKSADGRGKRPAKTILAEAKMSGAKLVAANFYQAEFDDYVPLLYKQLGAA